VRWCRDVAGARIHGTTRKVPREVYEQVERAHMLAASAEPYVQVRLGRVWLHHDGFHVVRRLAGQGLSLPQSMVESTFSSTLRESWSKRVPFRCFERLTEGTSELLQRPFRVKRLCPLLRCTPARRYLDGIWEIGTITPSPSLVSRAAARSRRRSIRRCQFGRLGELTPSPEEVDGWIHEQLHQEAGDEAADHGGRDALHEVGAGPCGPHDRQEA